MNATMTVEEALARVIASGAPPLAEEKVVLEQAYGRVLVRDLKALRTQPPFPNSAMDGYAVRAADTAPARATLTVIGESAAGRAFEGVVGPGEAVRIFTGAPMPAGADAMVIQENTTREGEAVQINAAASPNDNVRPAAGDFAAGDELLSAGVRLDPWRLSLAAAAGRAALAVARKPR
ncbi:MAG TPA: molybdopterin molybdenumtransferase MoeA, partial [Roseiarcus sp.]